MSHIHILASAQMHMHDLQMCKRPHRIAAKCRTISICCVPRDACYAFPAVSQLVT